MRNAALRITATLSENIALKPEKRKEDLNLSLTFERKKSVRVAGSKGIRPETVNGRDFAAINLATFVR